MVRGTPLRMEEREEISRGLAEDLPGRLIAARIGRHWSVVGREIVRNGGRSGYRAHEAQARADTMVLRPKPRKLEANQQLHDSVAAGLKNAWSPEQVSARLVALYPGEEAMRVSHETIYETLFCQGRGELRTQLRLALRTGRAQRGCTRPRQARISGMTLISERPAEVADRAVPGHWEGWARAASRRLPHWSSAPAASCCCSGSPTTGRRIGLRGSAPRPSGGFLRRCVDR